MKETRIIIHCSDIDEVTKKLKILAEQNFNPLFSETFLSVDKPLALHLNR